MEPGVVAECGPIYYFFRDRGQFKHAAVLRGFCQIACAQGKANGFELLHICRRQIRRPRRIVLD
jgi:hypothetical protein